MRNTLPLVLVLILLFTSCEGNEFQSMLHPVSPDSGRINWLFWVLTGISSAMLGLTMLLLLLALLAKPTKSPPGDRFILIWGVALPTVVLLGILFLALDADLALRPAHRDDPNQLRISVKGHMWWWEVRYPDLGIVTANEIHIPVGRRVRLELSSADVVHSLWIPNLNGKMDMMPDHNTYLRLLADRPGEFRGACAEYCGLQHALMAFRVIVLEEEDFLAWAAERQPKPPPTDPILTRGHKVFFRAACHSCHTISGTKAVGTAGPDLTHIGSRRTLAAGTMMNNRENMADWILNPGRRKPGNRMPPTPLEREDLDALVAYLESLQ
jgi:cytochrome c oxidase subunit II